MPVTERDREIVEAAFALGDSGSDILPQAAEKSAAITPESLMTVAGKSSAASEKAADEQDTKKKECESEPKPGVVRLESASDTPPKKAPEKKPEAESENAPEKKAAIDPSSLVEAARQLRAQQAAREEAIGVLPTIGGAAAGGAGGYSVLRLMQAARHLATKFPAFGRVIAKLTPYAGLGLGAAGAGLGGYLATRGKFKQPTAEVGPDVLEQLAKQLGTPKQSAYVSQSSDVLGLPVRGEMTTSKRDEVFRDVARWSLGQDTDEKSAD
ncbi:hypothetical protein LCGC14_0557850 [marine sediment metagenome]|uniref:Uncharacterized protein n=1 Tax=marine sediment metagenome TaxID=412755 RepID=A0A0F9S6L2_9ZZZZ